MKKQVERVHADSMRLDIHDLVRLLIEQLGPVVVQAMTGTKDRGQPSRWAKPDGPKPRFETERQLRLGYRVWKMIEQEEGSSIALAWLMGSNPRLEERTPVSAIRAHQSSAVIGAAQAFLDGVGGE